MLTEGQRQVRDMARQFAARELAPTAAERDRIPRFPREAFARMGELGMWHDRADEVRRRRPPTISYALPS